MDEKTKQKQDELIKLVSSFCLDELNEEYEQLAIKLVEKMGRKRDVPFKRGKLEIWASGVIYLLAQLNSLFDKTSPNHISGDDICEYFATKKSTVSKKANSIHDMFNPKDLHRNFTLSWIKEFGSEDEYHSFLGDVVSFIGEEESSNFDKRGFSLRDVIKASSSPDEMMGDDTSQSLYIKGYNLFVRGDFNDALEVFNKSLELNPNQAQVLYYKSQCLANLNKMEDALITVNEAISIDPTCDSYWNDKGNYLSVLGKVDEAAECFDKAFELNPTDSILLANKGFLYTQYERYDEALKAYDDACKLDPYNIHNIIGKVNVYMEMEKYSHAKKYLRRASKIDPEDLEYLTAMAHFMTLQNKFNEAIHYWDKCLDITDNPAVILIHKGMCYGMMGNVNECDKCINEAIEIDPSAQYILQDLVNG